MKYILELKQSYDDILFKSIKFLESKREWRAVLKIKRENNYLIFEVKAQDPNALRAQINQVLRLLVIYEKLNNLL